MNMRAALLNNLIGFDAATLKQTIDDGIKSQEETILVGLGVLFEEYYRSLDDNSKMNFLQNLSSLL